MATPGVSHPEEATVVVSPADFESAALRFHDFIAGLPTKEKEVMGWLLDRAGWAPALPPLHFPFHPRGAKHLVIGGADGILVLISRSGFHVTPPEGPLPTDISGTALVPSER